MTPEKSGALKAIVIVKDVVGMVLKPGDALLLHGPWENLRTQQDKTGYVPYNDIGH